MDSPARDPLLGRLVARRYRVLARIARGGMATVYRAEDTRLGREIALKVMHPHLAESDDFVARFHDEARAAASLSHRHVVAVHDQGEDGEVVWLAMELLPGRTLRDQLRERGAFTPAEAFDVMEAVLLALTEAHATGLVHRDVKPENVMIGRDGTYKVNDFGLARAAASSRTATGSLLGTPEYIAPETARTGQVDERVDLYSAGIVLFELLTGRQPHTGEVPFQVIWAHVTTDVPPPSRWAPYLPAAVDEVVADACERDPDARVRTATTMLADLRRVWSSLDPDVLDSRPTPRTADDAEGAEREDDTDVQDDAPDGSTAVIQRHGPLVRATALGAAGGTATLTTRTGGPGSRTRTDRRDDRSDDRSDDRYGRGRSDPDGYGPDLDSTDGDDPFPEGSGQGGERRDGVSRTAVLKRPGRRGPGLAGVLLVLLLASLGAGAALWYYEAGPGALRAVPDLRGQTTAAAEQRLLAAGLASTTTSTFDEQAPVGTVVDTSPDPGGQVHKNGTVTLVVSSGPELFDVPDLRGRSQAQAEDLLGSANLALGAVDEAYSSQVDEGLVVSSDPATGEALRGGTEVSLVLSLGPEPVTVPDVTGSGTDEARSQLEGVGLRLGSVAEQFADATPGTVVAQEPSEGRLLPGTTVDVVVSLGPEPVAVPDVFETRYDDAVAQLEDLGFVVERRGSGIFNRVVSQDPSAGTELPPGSTVTVTTF